MTMLEVERLQVSYGPVEALRGINITVPEGRVVGIIGANGAGKTTLLRTISGLVRARTGSIRFGNMEICRASSMKIVNAGLSHVPEGRRVWPEMTVEENLFLGGVVSKCHESIAERRRSVLAQFPELTDRLKQKAGTLSGGEQQMLAIGRGLMSRPRLLMLDEPSLGLAPVMMRRLKEIILNLSREGITVLLSEQNARLTLGATQHVYVLTDGRVARSGTPTELLEDADLIAAYLGESTNAGH